MPPTITRDKLAAGVVDLGRLALLFGTVDRITYHQDGTTPESDTDHTVMLGLAACAIAASYEPDLDLGMVAQFSLVHDVVEAYAGDTQTLVGYDAVAREAKKEREHAALERILDEFGGVLPWLPLRIAQYERQDTPEARFVRALDKLLPKVTHLLNNLATMREQGMTAEQMRQRYTDQAAELAAYAGDFPSLMQLRAELVDQVLALATREGDKA